MSLKHYGDKPRCNGKYLSEEIDSWETGDSECNAESFRYSCGAVYHHNYMDVLGSRDHDCFWDCTSCKRINE